jgi:hypothetical protein
LVKKAAGEGNKTFLTLAFMSFKLVSDAISHLVEASLVEREIIDDDNALVN